MGEGREKMGSYTELRHPPRCINMSVELSRGTGVYLLNRSGSPSNQHVNGWRNPDIEII